MRTAICAAVALVIAAPAWGAAIQRSEAGGIEFVISAPVGLQETKTVGEGDAVWTEAMRPAHWVRLTADAATRNRPGRIEGAQAGTLLFGYTLSHGIAYCPADAIDLGVEVRRVQCLLDVDRDGSFEGSYVTDSRGDRWRMLQSGMRGLSPMPRVTYEPVNESEGTEFISEVVFSGWENGRALFRRRVEGHWMMGKRVCEPSSGGVCVIDGLTLQVVEVDNGGARIMLIGQPARRRVLVDFAGS